MNDVLLRALTGSIFVVSIIASIWFNQYLAFGVFSLFFGAGIIEYANLFKTNSDINFPKLAFNFFGFIFIVLILLANGLGMNKASLENLFLPLTFLFVLTELWRNKANPTFNVAISVFGLIYLLVPFKLIIELVNVTNHENILLIGMFFLIWTNDTFAYLTGRFIGKTKLFERISPNKTWEGTLGGVFFTILLGWILGYSTGDYLFWIIAASLISPLAIFGDLFESLIKRNLNIKDSGSILPGHGGILDRFDATLFAVPFFYSWVKIYPFLFV